MVKVVALLDTAKCGQRLRKKGIMVERARVMTLMRELDPERVESRRKKRLRRRASHIRAKLYIAY